MAENYESISKVYKNIIKSEEDAKIYCGVELSNKMRVLLISDPDTDKSAASMNVHIGFMSDPSDIPGIAHFCEHMLFLGTEKYPVENEYNKFLQGHGGTHNAYTGVDNTCYYFDVAPDSMKEALDRFAQFFLCPLFTESATEREVNAVNSEHEKNLQIDPWRLSQLEKSTCAPGHDYSKFGTGNIDTLWKIPKAKGINVRDELLKFHKYFYSSNIMSLVVLAKETIEELLDIIVPLFGRVSNKNIEIPVWEDHPFDSNQLKLQGFVVPVKDIKSLNISFPVPDLNHLYKTNPAHYLSHLIGHEGPGSLLSELKALGWANKLLSGYRHGAKGFAFFIINIDLTNEGIDHVDDIVILFFQYLSMLKNEGPQDWIFEECRKLYAMAFRFKDVEKPLSYTCSLASVMFDYPMEEVLSGPYLLEIYDPELINNLLDMLTPDKIRIAIVAKKFGDICTDVEKWYGTLYKLQPISEETINAWKNVEPHPNFKLPTPNEFIPNNFQLVPRENNSKYPELLKNTALGHLWFKQDDEFHLPKAILNFEFESPIAYLDPVHHNMSRLFVELVKDSLNEYSYAAELAGLSYSLHSTKLGIFLIIGGYSDKQHVFLKKVMNCLTNFKVDKRRFDILKEELLKGLRNFNAEQPHRHAVYYTSMLLAERIWSNDELLNSVDEITIENLEQMISRLLSKVHIEALIYGNVTKKQALSMMNIVESCLKNVDCRYLMQSQLIREREVHLSDGHQYVHEVINEIHPSSSIETYFQCGTQETRSNMLLELLCELISEPCFDFLRTKEQLGYIVWSGVRRSHGCQGLRILVQSDKHPSFLDGKVEAFIQYFEKHILEMNDKEFQNHIKALTTLRLEKPKMLKVQSAKYWLEISNRQYNFKRDSIEVAALQNITKEELYSYFKDLIAYDAPHRKKLSVHIISSSCESSQSENYFLLSPSVEEEISNSVIPPPPAFRPSEKIQDITAFKHSLGLYPLVPPSIHIPQPMYDVQEKSKL